MEAEQKYGALLGLLRATEGVLVAFSGGVDSSLLLVAAREALGPRAVAAIGCSPSFPALERERAVELVRLIGGEPLCIETTELTDPVYRQNPPDRCFICKRTLFSALQELAATQGLPVVVEGSNADDRLDYRPGMRAAQQMGVRAPLAEVGLTKTEIRALARARRLAVWDKPSLACLASRIPYGSEITEERLARIDRAETAIRAQGFAQVRVRDHGDVARIEVAAEEIRTLADPHTRQAVVAAVKSAGYCYVSLDLEGYRTGAMNEVLVPRAPSLSTGEPSR